MGADIGRIPEDTVRSRPNGTGSQPRSTRKHPRAADLPPVIPHWTFPGTALMSPVQNHWLHNPPPTPPTRCTSVYALTGASEGEPDRPPNGCG